MAVYAVYAGIQYDIRDVRLFYLYRDRACRREEHRGDDDSGISRLYHFPAFGEERIHVVLVVGALVHIDRKPSGIFPCLFDADMRKLPKFSLFIFRKNYGNVVGLVLGKH